MMRLFFLLFPLSLGACALTSKGDALRIRYFTPESTHVRVTSASPGCPIPTGAGSACPVPANAWDHHTRAVELGRVWSGLHLREKIAYRDGAFEVGYYDDLRWTERPEVFVRRTLGRTLYEDHGMK